MTTPFDALDRAASYAVVTAYAEQAVLRPRTSEQYVERGPDADRNGAIVWGVFSARPTSFDLHGQARGSELDGTTRVNAARSEFWIAIAGPTMSLALAASCWLAHVTLEATDVSAPVQAVLGYLALINLILAVFNLLPAFPLDGGRVLRAALWQRSGDIVAATRQASMISEFLAYGLMTFGLLALFSGNTAGGLWQVLIAFFLLSAARATYQQLVMKTALGKRTVGSMMTRNTIVTTPDDTLAKVVDRLMLPNAVSFLPVTEGELLLGYVDTALIRRIDRENWDSTHVGDIYITADAGNTVPPTLPAETLLRRIAETGRRKFLVAEHQGLLGVITLTDLLSYLAVLQEIGVAGRPAFPTSRPANRQR